MMFIDVSIGDVGMIRQFGILCIALVVSTGAFAQYDDLTVMEVYGLGVNAYQEGDMQGFLAAMEELDRRRPHQFAVQYNYAIALAAAGQEDAAMSRLAYVADLGLSIDLAADEDFSPLMDHPGYEAIAARFSQNMEPAGISTIAHEFDELDLLVEGVAFHANHGLFVSTMRSGQILRMGPDGTLEEFANGNAHPAMAGILGMAVDDGRGVLWATSSAPEHYQGANLSLDPGSSLLGFDLETGLVRHAFELGEGNHFLGEVVISPDGVVYASDSASPVLYHVADDLLALVAADFSDQVGNLQGFDFGPDGQIYLADYLLGLYRLEPGSGTLVPLETANGINPTGIDGLFYRDGDLIGIQNATNPKRIVRFELSDDGTAVTGLEVLVSNHPDWDEPTLGQIVGDELLYVGTSEWPDYGADGTRREGTQSDPIRIMSVDLD